MEFPFQISTDCKGENSNLLFKASHKTQHLHFIAKKYACFQWDTVENKKGAHEVVSECGTSGGCCHEILAGAFLTSQRVDLQCCVFKDTWSQREAGTFLKSSGWFTDWVAFDKFGKVCAK